MKKLLLIGMGLLPLFAHGEEDTRQLVQLTPAAQAVLRSEMQVNMQAINDITALVVAGKLAEAGALATAKLGSGAMGKNRNLPMDARPGPQLPLEMRQIGMRGHQTADAFAQIAASSDRERTLAALPTLTDSCSNCHSHYRIR
jgi:hypothetical protein